MTFYVFTGLLIVCVFLVILGRYLTRFIGYPWLRWVFYLLVFGFMFGDIPLKHAQLYYLCHLQPLNVNFDSSRPLDAYVFNDGPSGCDERCLRALLLHHIKTVEVFVRNPSPALWAEQEGYHHYTISHPTDPNCRLFNDHPALPQGFVLPPHRCISSSPLSADPIYDRWRYLESFDIDKDLLFPYIEHKLVTKEKSTNEVLYIDYRYIMPVSWLFERISNRFFDGGSRGTSCSIPSIKRYPDLSQSKE